MVQKTQEDATFDCFEQYPWLRDFCTYVNRKEDELTWVEYYLRIAEIHWINCLSSWRYTLDKVEVLEHLGLKGWKSNEGIPDSLLFHLIQVFDHLSGSSQNFEKRSGFAELFQKNFLTTGILPKNPKVFSLFPNFFQKSAQRVYFLNF